MQDESNASFANCLIQSASSLKEEMLLAVSSAGHACPTISHQRPKMSLQSFISQRKPVVYWMIFFLFSSAPLSTPK